MRKVILSLAFCVMTVGAFAQLKEMVGIGVRLQLDSGRGYKLPLVIEVIPHGPAEEGGLKEGDFIISAGGQSTRDVVLKDVVAMLVGKEGTTVQLVMERSGAKRNYSLVRRNYKYADSYYKSAVKDNDFCNALVSFMNDAPYNFSHTIDTLHYTEGKGVWATRYFQCKAKIPGAEKVSIASSFGFTGVISLGSFKTLAEVSAAGTPVIANLKTCFPDYYYNPVVDNKGNVSIQIGVSYKDGFESSILTLTSAFDDDLNAYKLNLNVSGGKRTRYFSLTEPAQDNEFSVPVRAIYQDILKGYSHVKSTRHEEKGGFFGPTVWYDIVPMPDGAKTCTLTEGMGLANGCNCTFFTDEDRKSAVDAFMKVADKMRNSLGPDFVYTAVRGDLDMTIPTDAIAAWSFGIKKKKDYESGPLITLVMVKNTDGKYAVNMLFHKFGF